MTFIEYLNLLLQASKTSSDPSWFIKWNTACWFPIDNEWKILAQTVLHSRKAK